MCQLLYYFVKTDDDDVQSITNTIAILTSILACISVWLFTYRAKCSDDERSGPTILSANNVFMGGGRNCYIQNEEEKKTSKGKAS